ncbi:MAG: 30S ribosomal protein S21 [Patescibacteria group bacterium]|nr:30S ribosomal protein S21 [Patescibacteria group bacterium]MDD5567517.1 30S ribosomal protein S21 [Patescibacteria group bacterium]
MTGGFLKGEVNYVVEVRRKDGESGESLIRRFTRKVQQSGLLIRAKKRRFYEPPKTKRQAKEDAIRRKGIREQREYLKKIGKLDEWLERQGYRTYRGSKK